MKLRRIERIIRNETERQRNQELREKKEVLQNGIKKEENMKR